jgi:hypothetical protein
MSLDEEKQQRRELSLNGFVVSLLDTWLTAAPILRTVSFNKGPQMPADDKHSNNDP